MNITIAGGDTREKWLARLLREDGHRVTAVGLGEGGALAPGADAVILPLPALGPTGAVNTPLEYGVLLPEDVAAAIGETPVFAGKLPAEKAALFPGGAVDYYAREELMLRNADLTAEGALALLMEELPLAVRGLRVLIVGAGRIGLLLAEKLRALGAQVTVTARKEEDLTRVRLLDCAAARTEALEQAVRGKEAIFNTVPAPVFTPAVLAAVPKEALLVDLASRPGGFSLGEASALGLHAIKAASLPGKCAPRSAAAAIKDTLYSIFAERGMMHG